MMRTLAQRTYSELEDLTQVADALQGMIVENKTIQLNEATAVRGLISEVNNKMEVELPQEINSRLVKAFEEVKKENIKVWEVCLDYAQKIDGKKQDCKSGFTAAILKKGERLNNYTYAVGGKDSYGIPALGQIEREVNDSNEDDDSKQGDNSGSKAKNSNGGSSPKDGKKQGASQNAPPPTKPKKADPGEF